MGINWLYIVNFRGKRDGSLEKELQKNLYVKNNSILVKCQGKLLG